MKITQKQINSSKPNFYENLIGVKIQKTIKKKVLYIIRCLETSCFLNIVINVKLFYTLEMSAHKL